MDQNQLLTILKPEAEKIDRVMEDDLKSVENAQLAEVLRYSIFNGGKRIRPLLTLMAAKLSTKNSNKVFDDEEVHCLSKIAITFEYLHAASLLHDDVIDHAETRRGRPAANTVWGTTPVILAGDYLHSRAMRLAGTLGGANVLTQLADAAAAMVESEFIQMESVTKKDKTERSYFAVLHGKTAALIAAACTTGAIYSGAGGTESNALAVYGANIGLAFQIADDLLDYLGDSAKTGKAVGNDFVEGKMTLPLIYALEHASESGKQRLTDLLAVEPEARKNSVAEARDIVDAAGGFSYSRAKAEALIEEGASGLAVFPDCPEKEMLLALGQYVLNRKK